MRAPEMISIWEHTSTAFGEGRGCNFRIRIGGAGNATLKLLQDETFRLSRLIDHKCLEQDCAFFHQYPVTLENIAFYLFTERQKEFVDWVEVDGNENWRARVSAQAVSVTYTFSARNARRVWSVEVTTALRAGEFNWARGIVVEREALREFLRQHFKVPTKLADHGLERLFDVFSAHFLPRTLSAVIVRDAVENRVVLRLGGNDTSLASAPSLHL